MARNNRLVRPEVISSTYVVRVSNNSPRKSGPSWDRSASNKSWSFTEGRHRHHHHGFEDNGLGSEAIVRSSLSLALGLRQSFVQSVSVLEFAEDRGRANLHSWHDVPGHRVD
ncbi:hypothetical protein ABIF97_000586 [Bradyrhizobium japonicum]